MGKTWKEIFKDNYGEKGTKRQWLEGTFSKVTSHEQLLKTCMYPMSAESWGDILSMELLR